jgi:sodium-dependent phosphate cotransporter
VIPVARELPLRAAERLAEVAADRKSLAVAYVVGLFIIVPLVGVAVFR